MSVVLPAVGDQIAASYGDAVATQLNGGQYIIDAVALSTVTLSSTATNVASSAVATFTLSEQRRVRIVTSSQFTMASGTDGRYRQQSACNSGGTAIPGSATALGVVACLCITTVGDIVSGYADGTTLLAAGTYTAYALVQRNSGGSATDTARQSYVAVYDCGNV